MSNMALITPSTKTLNETTSLQLLSKDYPDFSNIKISTQTIIGASNLNFNIRTLFQYLPIVEYTVIEKRRGRKRKVEEVNPNKDIPVGSIISIQYKSERRGALIKKKKKSGDTYFLNSATIIVLLEDGKLINCKVSKNGKFQITGCKDNIHFIRATQYIYDKIQYAEAITGEKIIASMEGTHPRIIFNVVMRNIDLKTGFSIQRDKLDTFISCNTDFYSHYEGSVTTSVNIKIKNDQPHEHYLDCLELLPNNTRLTKVHYNEYLKVLDNKDKKKEETDEKYKYHTFLVFSTGSIIQSGRGPKMEEVYKKFMKIIMNHRKEFEEKINNERSESIN